MKIVVIGGTGLIGSKTVAILRRRGHEVVAASPKSGINTSYPNTETWLPEHFAREQIPRHRVLVGLLSVASGTAAACSAGTSRGG